MLDVVPSTERKENSKVKENSKGKTQPASVITASVTPPTIVSTWSLSKHSWSRSLVVSEFHDWSVVYSPLMFLSWPTMSLLIIFSVHHPFISQGWTGLLSSSHFGTDFCVSKFIFFFFLRSLQKNFPRFFLPAGLLSLPEPFFESRQVSAISPAQ